MSFRGATSALLRPLDEGDEVGDTDTQGRFSALRQFRLLTCNATDPGGCSDPDGDLTGVYTSPETAGSGPASADQPRPTAPDLQIAGFDVRDTRATHVQIRTLSNQCTGAPAYQGDQDNDPANNSDCVTGSDADRVIRAAEVQVFGK